jgi:hypothetical protein
VWHAVVFVGMSGVLHMPTRTRAWHPNSIGMLNINSPRFFKPGALMDATSVPGMKEAYSTASVLFMENELVDGVDEELGVDPELHTVESSHPERERS